jgi:molecular chaperone DnaK
VTFDIDANGIMNVSAKDKATGKQNSVTIKSSGGLNDSEIEKMVQEAEAAREQDQKKKEGIEAKNEADTLVYNTEKQLQEHGDKIPDSVKDQIRTDISGVNEAITTDDSNKIKEALEKLRNSSMEIGKSIYAQQNNSEQQSEQAPEGEAEKQAEEEPKKEEEKKQ